MDIVWTPEDLVLWSDDAVLVVDKPAGLLVIRGGFGDDPYLTRILEPAFGRLWIVHRLDRETSGLVVLARTAAAHRALNTQFQEHDVVKLYHALVCGEPPWKEQTVNLPLRRDGDRRHRTVVDLDRGKPSITRLHVLERLGRYTLLEAAPRTGRTHQIRAHLAALGFPIVGDALYGGGQDLYLRDVESSASADVSRTHPLIARVALHACALTFTHPVTGETMRFGVPYPDDIAVTLRHLRERPLQCA